MDDKQIILPEGESEPDDFQKLSAAQLETYKIEGEVQLNRLELSNHEAKLIVNFFSKLVYKANGDRHTGNTKTINFIRAEIATGKYWLMLTEEQRRDYLRDVVKFSPVGIAKNYPFLVNAFSKIHASAWIGRLKFCVGKVIYEGIIDLEP